MKILNINKLFLILSICIVNSFALTISIEQEVKEKQKNIIVTQEEISSLKDTFQAKMMTISDEDAKDFIVNNKLLSNEFIKKYGISKNELLKIQISLEEEFANKFVEKNKEDTKIDDEIIESYYKTYKNRFAESKIIEANFITFNTYEEAHKFYIDFKTDASKAIEFAKSNNIENKDDTKEIKKLHQIIQDGLKNIDKTNILIHPIFIKSKFLVIAIKNLQTDDKKTYKDYKKIIIQELNEKTFKKTRFELIEELKK